VRKAPGYWSTNSKFSDLSYLVLDVRIKM
jgi:hypothetical protein